MSVISMDGSYASQEDAINLYFVLTDTGRPDDTPQLLFRSHQVFYNFILSTSRQKLGRLKLQMKALQI